MSALKVGHHQSINHIDINILIITVCEFVVNTKSVVMNLGPWFDFNLVCLLILASSVAQAFFHLHNISRIHKFLSPAEETKTLVHAFVTVTSRVDYCNSLLYGLPASQFNKVQRVSNTAAKLVCCAPRFSHFTPLMH